MFAAAAVGVFAFGCALLAALAMARPLDRRATPSLLAPDPQLVRYRHAIANAPPLDEDIAALEARARTPAASPFDLAELADLHVRRGRATGDPAELTAAEALARRALALAPMPASSIAPSPNPAALVLGKLAAMRHAFPEAIELARRHLDGRSAGALMVLATSHLALGELAQAAADAEALVENSADSAAYAMRALVMQAQGRDAEAAFDFARAAAAEEPGDAQEAARLRALWARFLLRRGELAGARRVVDEALRIAPRHALALAQDGELLLRTGRPRDARARFEQAFAASRQVRYLMDQARAQEQAGDRAGAAAVRAQVEKIVRAELIDGGTGHRLDLVETLIDRGGVRGGDAAEAIALAREEVAHRPSAEARFQLARALARAGGRDEALRHVHAALAAGTREAPLYALAAQLEQQRGNTARAALYAGEAARLDPSRSAR